MYLLKIKRSLILFIIYSILICLIIILADMNKLPLYLIYTIPHYDWIAHFFLYGFFYFLLDSLLKDKRICFYKWSFSLPVIIAGLVIAGEEFSQLLFPWRTFSLIDLFMGFLGIYFWFRIANRRKEKKTVREEGN